MSLPYSKTKAGQNAIYQAAKTFRWYEELHRAKPDPDKAMRNAQFAKSMEQALSILEKHGGA